MLEIELVDLFRKLTLTPKKVIYFINIDKIG